MANFDSGVKKFIKAEATVTVYFPVDMKDRAEVNCMVCKFFNRTSGRCVLTQEISEYPKHYIGSHCPLDVIEELQKENEI